VAIKNGCWVYSGHKDSKGYGAVRVGSRKDGTRRMEKAHRYAWSLINGAIPKGMMILHRCDNPSCVKPGHLFVGTNQDNMDDMVRKGRANVSTCENGTFAIMNRHEATEAINRMLDGESPTRIAHDMPVSREMLYHIRARRAWKTLFFEIINKRHEKETA